MSPLAPELTAEDLQDMAHYLQMLIQLMMADGHLHPAEQARIKEYASQHGYSERFIDETMATALTNRFLERQPHQFHSQDTARLFLRDAVVLARCDGILHDKEHAWLTQAAQSNGLDLEMWVAESERN